MATIPAGPFLDNVDSNIALNILAPDPGPLVAGAAVTPHFLSLKRKRLEMIHTLDSSLAEKKTATDILHELEHRSMALAVDGNVI